MRLDPTSPKDSSPKCLDGGVRSERMESGGVRGRGGSPGWAFLTNHAVVLMCLAADPAVRLRDVAVRARITERAVLRIVSDLERDGYVRRVREGRRNRYEIDTSRPLHYPVDTRRNVGCLLDLLESTRVTEVSRVS